MGKSSSTSASCLKIIACGSDTAASDDSDTPHPQPQAKGSQDKRGWSFRKRSGRHRVLGNNVTSEISTFAEKEIPHVHNTDHLATSKSTSSDEKPQLSKPAEKVNEVSVLEYDGQSKTSMEVVASGNDFSASCVDSKVGQEVVAVDSDSNSAATGAKLATDVFVPESDSGKPSASTSVANESVVLEVESDKSAEPEALESVIASEDGVDTDFIVDELAVIVIQTAIRRYLARKAFLQLKSAIKLQAVIRGHLVRRNAIETLHCIQGITKVQALVRARSSKSLEQKYRPNDARFSTVNLLKNSFARQLLESTPKSKSVNVRCDPLSPSSAWTWLERWMSVPTSEIAQEVEPSETSSNEVELSEKPKNNNTFLTNNFKAEPEVPSVVLSSSFDSMISGEEVLKSSETEANLFIHNVENVNSESSLPMPMESQISHSPMTGAVNESVTSVNTDTLVIEVSDSQTEPIYLYDEPVAEMQQPKLSSKRFACEELDGEISSKRSASEELNDEGKKTLYASKKAISPTFIAAQSKFEELSAAANSGKSIGSSHQEIGAETHVDVTKSLEGVTKTDEPCILDVSVPTNPCMHVQGSECGTELSISSTLDSPDRCELVNAQAGEEVKVLEVSHDSGSTQGQNCATIGMASHPTSSLPSDTTQQEEVQGINDESVDPVEAEISPQVGQNPDKSASILLADATHMSSLMDRDSSLKEQKHELNGHDAHVEYGPATGHQTYKLSPEASPKSHLTFPESQGTPSSQVSVKSKRNKIDKIGSKAKRSSMSAGKKSPSTPHVDSGTRSSTEHLPKDHKNGKRRNSFGSTKSDNAEQEPRDSSSQNSLPSYMQATKSAKAKAQSPRASPDLHDKELYSKKRHSLPGAGGRQESPVIQRSTSQAAQGVKANGSHPSNERKWQR